MKLHELAAGNGWDINHSTRDDLPVTYYDNPTHSVHVWHVGTDFYGFLYRDAKPIADTRDRGVVVGWLTAHGEREAAAS